MVAVGSAEDWGTYVVVHADTHQAVNRAIDAEDCPESGCEFKKDIPKEV